MDTITYHKATQHDIQVLVDTRIRFAIELAGNQTKDAIENLKLQMTKYFEKAIRENTCVSYIAKSDKEIAGIGSFCIREQPGNFKNPSGRSAYLMNMYTLPLFRRKGICTGILSLLMDSAKLMGIKAFELHATNEGEYVYKQHGFEIHNEPTYRQYFL